jgi:DNA-directed RNA polymerase specialized sigma24 family protein
LSAFPETRPTLIARLASGGSEADWKQFLADYWGPVVRFVARAGQLPLDQAEDVASETFQVFLRSPLLARWVGTPTAKLRSLLCGVVRNVLSNRRRVAQGRVQALKRAIDAGNLSAAPHDDLADAEPATADVDTFYAAWVDDLLASTMRGVMTELHAEGKGDYFRALYGRVCEGLSAAELAEALGASPSEIENYLRVARSRLRRKLDSAVRDHVQRYSPDLEVAAEFHHEWNALEAYLQRYGGLEQAIRREAESPDHMRHRPTSKTIAALKLPHEH